jgi:hypothetical protein
LASSILSRFYPIDRFTTFVDDRPLCAISRIIFGPLQEVMLPSVGGTATAASASGSSSSSSSTAPPASTSFAPAANAGLTNAITTADELKRNSTVLPRTELVADLMRASAIQTYGDHPELLQKAIAWPYSFAAAPELEDMEVCVEGACQGTCVFWLSQHLLALHAL